MLIHSALVLFSGVMAVSMVAASTVPSAADGSFSIVTKLYDECSAKDYSLSTCFKMKAVTLFDRVARSDSIPFGEQLSFVKEEKDRQDYGRAITENDLESSLASTSEEQKDTTLNSMLLDRVSRFMNSHTIKISLPKLSSEDLSRSLEEARGKSKKQMSMIMMAIAMKAMMLIPLAIGALFLLAGKAFIISKIALVLALIITLKKLLSKQHEHPHEHGWSSGGGGHGGGWDRRSLINDVTHNLAYGAQKPQQ
nr:PREDICTED: uncharacterized protein LOC109030184 [Bemisia tabaci]